MERNDGFELEQDLRHQRREWRLEVVGMIVLSTMVIAALLGVFGSGPVSSASKGSEASGVTIAYERVLRHQGRGSFEVEIDPAMATEGTVEFWIGEAYLETIEIQNVRPEPGGVSSANAGTMYTFEVEPDSDTIVVVVDFVPDTIGIVDGTIRIGDGEPLSFTQVVLP